MGEKPKRRRSSNDNIIIEFLRGKSWSRKKLLQLNKQKESVLSKIPYKTLDRRLKQLEKYGILEHIPDVYKLAEHVEEVNTDEIQEIIEVIDNNNTNKEVLYSRLRELRLLSSAKRIGRVPMVISTLEASLADSRVVDNPKIFEELILTLKNILIFERENKLQESEKIIEEIISPILKKMLDVLRRNAELPSKYVIGFLGETGKNGSVKVLFELMHRFKHELSNDQIENFANTLNKLMPKYFRTINRKIDYLIGSKDKDLQRIGGRIREIISWQRKKQH